MNDNCNAIWKQLQQHSMQPPEGIFDKVWQHILQQQLHPKNSAEWNNDIPTESEINERSIFSKLQQYSIAPPGLQWSSNGAEKKESPKKRKFFYLDQFGKAAAVLLLAGGIAFFWMTVPRKKKNNPGSQITTTTKVSPTIVPSSPIVIGANDTPLANNQIQLKIDQKNIAKQQDQEKKKAVLPMINNSVAAYENDFLLTLINYEDEELQQFSTKIINKKKIMISQYSYINLSDKMAQMVQDLCSVKPNGKPTKKAKKTKRKFERWKKMDEKYFDRGPQKNPADIIDLSDFIMKK